MKSSMYQYIRFALAIFTSLVGAAALSASKGLVPVPEKSNHIIVFIGDSLAAGYGVRKEEAFPEVTEQILKAHGYEVKVINGGISGSVTAGADRRVEWFLKAKPEIVVLELGGNDGLKGTPIDVIKKNLRAALEVCRSHKVKTLLVGMRLYANLGQDYAKKFENIYIELSREMKVQLLPFLLADVALKPELNQTDMKHPNAKGHAIVAKSLASALEKML
jgi:acyl-CoA thioesterase-1